MPQATNPWQHALHKFCTFCRSVHLWLQFSVLPDSVLSKVMGRMQKSIENWAAEYDDLQVVEREHEGNKVRAPVCRFCHMEMPMDPTKKPRRATTREVHNGWSALEGANHLVCKEGLITSFFFFFSTSLRVVDRTDEFLSHVLLWAAVVIKCLVLVPFAFMYMLLGFLHGKTWISKWHPITPKILLQKIALNFYDLNFEKG